MPYVSIHVDLEDVYNDLSKSEKEMLVDWLEQDDILPTVDDILPTVNVSNYNGLMNHEFTETCSKLAQSYYRMSKEDEETIVKIMKKYN
jgi:hypothetical protein